MSTDRLGAKLAVAIAALLMLAAACGKSDNSGPSAGGGTTGSSGSQGSSGSSGGGAYGGGYGGGGGYGKGGGGNGAMGSSGGSQPSGNSVMTIQQDNYSFDPATFTVGSGETITIKNGNAGTPHNFTVKGMSVDITNDPLGSQDVTIDLQPGTYEFFCKFHVQLGMKGTLTVT
ncbi:MAG: cupredoxin domain-containing protein [Actinomycetota bacterium]